ncbi:MAG: esterase [Acidobacteriales bacterium]|nr:esterase [Terriglobales bacterium]
MKRTKQLPIVLCTLLLSAVLAVAQSGGSKSQILDRVIHSKNFEGNKIGVSADRKLAVYLPAGYGGASKRYPVLYYFPSPMNDYRALFDKSGAQALFDRAIARGTVRSFILVSVDMTTPLGASWFVNSPVTGNWEDFAVEELVPYVDASFRTIPTRASRGLVGHHMGAYGAIRVGMKHPDVFGSIYAMNPVGTGSGVQIMDSRPNWDLLAHAASLDEVKKDGFSTIFTSIFQAHLPNPGKPPLYADLPAHREGGKLVIDAKLTARLRDSFFLESMIPQYADNLKKLRGFKFDWSRNDGIWDHVFANHALTHKLNEFGIVHEAEEYNGLWDEDPYWGAEGRVTADVLPFFQQHLEFQPN